MTYPQVVGWPDGGASEPTILSPLGGGLNDAPVIQAALNASAYARPVQFGPGTYTVDTVINVPSGSILMGSPGVQINSTIAPTVGGGGSPVETVFLALPPSYTVITTLTAAATTGSRTIAVTSAAGFSIGQEIALTNGNLTAGYFVTNIVGNTITLDRQILYPFPVLGTSVIDRVTPKDIYLLADGMRVNGTGDAVVEWSGALRCKVRGLIVSPRYGTVDFQYVVVNFDVGSRECRLERCHLDGGGNSDSIWHFESAEDCVALQVRARGGINRAWFLTAGYGNSVISCTAEDSAIGATVEAADGTNGARAATVTGCNFRGNTGTGLAIQNACERVSVIGCHASHNGGTGFAAGGGSGASTDVTFAACHSHDNTGAGFYTIAGARDVHILGCTADRNGQWGFEGEGEYDVTNSASRDCTSGGIRVGAAGRASVSNVQLGRSLDGGWAAFTQQSTDSRALRIQDARVEMSGMGTKIVISSQAAGTTYAENLVSTGGTFGWVASAGTFRRGARVDLESAGTPYSGGTIVDTMDWPLTPTAIKTSAYTAAVGDLVLCDPTGGGFQVDLPLASTSNVGRKIGVKNDSASTNAITIARSGAQTIDGATSASLTQARAYLEFRSTGSGWVVA